MHRDSTLHALADAIEAVSVRYAERFAIRRDLDWCLLKLTEELGELTQAHLKRTGQARVDAEPTELTRRFEDEMADVLGQLLVLAKLSGTDLYTALDRKWLRWHPARLPEAVYQATPVGDAPEHDRTASLAAKARVAAVHPVLMSNDLNASVTFFERLGFTLLFRDDPAEARYAVLRRDDAELHLQWQSSDHWKFPIDRPVYRFVVSNVDAIFEEFVTDGVLIEESSPRSPWARPADTPWETREFHVRDPAGNGLQFYARRADAKA